jgi:hypothetical protein
MTPASVKVILQPIGWRVTVPAPTTVLDVARVSGVELVAICGGEGRIDDPPFSSEILHPFLGEGCPDDIPR